MMETKGVKIKKQVRRRCLKCGCSPVKHGVKLFRFPKPVPANLIRCTLWAKYVLPEGKWCTLQFLKDNYWKQRSLCHKHFREADFKDSDKTKLHRTAVPTDELLTEELAEYYKTLFRDQRRRLKKYWYDELINEDLLANKINREIQPNQLQSDLTEEASQPQSPAHSEPLDETHPSMAATEKPLPNETTATLSQISIQTKSYLPQTQTELLEETHPRTAASEKPLQNETRGTLIPISIHSGPSLAQMLPKTSAKPRILATETLQQIRTSQPPVATQMRSSTQSLPQTLSLPNTVKILDARQFRISVPKKRQLALTTLMPTKEKHMKIPKQSGSSLTQPESFLTQTGSPLTHTGLSSTQTRSSSTQNGSSSIQIRSTSIQTRSSSTQTNPSSTQPRTSLIGQPKSRLAELFSEFDAYDETTDAEQKEKNTCEECRDIIDSTVTLKFRYACVECADYDLCGACESQAHHARHYVIRIPPNRDQAEISGVLKAIRGVIEDVEHLEVPSTHTPELGQLPLDVEQDSEMKTDDDENPDVMEIDSLLPLSPSPIVCSEEVLLHIPQTDTSCYRLMDPDLALPDLTKPASNTVVQKCTKNNELSDHRYSKLSSTETTGQANAKTKNVRLLNRRNKKLAKLKNSILRELLSKSKSEGESKQACKKGKPNKTSADKHEMSVPVYVRQSEGDSEQPYKKGKPNEMSVPVYVRQSEEDSEQNYNKGKPNETSDNTNGMSVPVNADMKNSEKRNIIKPKCITYVSQKQFQTLLKDSKDMHFVEIVI